MSRSRGTALALERLEHREVPTLLGPIDNSLNAGVNLQQSAVGDFNRDGKPDLVAVHNGGNGAVTLMLGTGGGGFTASNIAGGGCQAVAVSDLNGDGYQDIAYTSFGNLAVLLGNGAGGFAQGPFTSIGGGASISIVVGDFNGDGRPDVAAANYFNNNLVILMGDGNGGFSSAAGSPISIGTNPYSLAMADFNLDGRLDLSVPNLGNTNLAVLLGNGNGTFSPAAGSPIPIGGLSVGPVTAGDFNSDGKPDLVTEAFFLAGNGSGGFTQTSLGANVFRYAGLAVDLNGDGRLDLVGASFNPSLLQVLLGSGDGAFKDAPGTPFGLAAGVSSTSVADFNGDGAPDLAMVNYLTGSVTIAFNHGLTTTTVSSSAADALYGQAIRFTATVTAASGAAPTGTVTFRNGGAVLGTATVTSGVATLSFSTNTPLGAGTYDVT